MKYSWFLIILISCKGEFNRTAAPINARENYQDSLLKQADSTIATLSELDSLAKDIKESVINTVDSLTIQKDAIAQRLEYGISDVSGFVMDNKEKTIVELLKKIRVYEVEIAQLKKRLYNDSLSRLREPKGLPFIMPEVLLPDENSLIIDLKGDKTGVSVYLIPYSKKARKLMNYDFCDMSKINKLDGIESAYYSGIFFFNDIKPGKYVVKVCTYYGGFKLIERTEGYQVITMKVSPPTQ